MAYTVRAVDGAEHQAKLHAMHTLTFPEDDHVDYGEGWWWLAFEADEPVGFAGMRVATTETNAIYLSRCGILSGHRGKGLQSRLLAARIRHARKEGSAGVITTTFDNPPSGNNLIKAGFRLYLPRDPWGRAGTNYWRLDLPSSK